MCLPQTCGPVSLLVFFKVINCKLGEEDALQDPSNSQLLGRGRSFGFLSPLCIVEGLYLCVPWCVCVFLIPNRNFSCSQIVFAVPKIYLLLSVVIKIFSAF